MTKTSSPDTPTATPTNGTLSTAGPSTRDPGAARPATASARIAISSGLQVILGHAQTNRKVANEENSHQPLTRSVSEARIPRLRFGLVAVLKSSRLDSST